MKNILNLLASMRFAISMLLLVAIASIIGSILKQAEPYNNYINRFGDFWTGIFFSLSLNEVYNCTWFLGILFFLVLSTSICIIRTWPKFYKQLSNYQLKVRKEFLLQQKMHVEINVDKTISLDDITNFLSQYKFKYRIKQANTYDLVAAKNGDANKYGYLFAHIGIIVICIGGLLDGNIPLKIKQYIGVVQPFEQSMLAKNDNILPQKSILPLDNSSFRANLFVPEKKSGDMAIINTSKGILGQKLPFSVQLNKFNVEYYSTGMPKKFTSNINIIDSKDVASSTPVTVEVNKPYNYKGYNIYQSSFEDGGSLLRLNANALHDNIKLDKLNIIVGDKINIEINNKPYILELNEFRAINVHNISEKNSSDNNSNILNKIVAANMRSQQQIAAQKTLRNIGPSIQYTLRDNLGQAIAYHSYMLPVNINNKSTFLVGMRANNIDEFKYLHIPADSKGSVKDWLLIHNALQNANLRKLAALNYTKQYVGSINNNNNSTIKTQENLFSSSNKALELFAAGGLQGVAGFIEKNVKPSEQAKASQVILRMLQGSMWSLWQEARRAENLDVPNQNADNEDFLSRSLVASSDAALLMSPVWFSLATFDEKKASVFQITKSPGQNIVYLGCLMLVIGVFLMIFIQEKRIWIMLYNKDKDNKNQILMAMQFQRKNIDAEKMFKELAYELEYISKETYK
jgi:cytochrome c biogenesis protein